MRYIVDNDLHIHSFLSSCSRDEEQTSERILQYAKENKLKTVCLANHFWDESVHGASDWYAPQGYTHISQAKPLPQEEGIRFLFGCEAELNKELVLGVSKERISEFDFIVISTTHFHMKGFTLTDEENSSAENKAIAWIKRLDTVFGMDLPFYKVGIAHLACKLIAAERDEYLRVLELLPENELIRVFTKAAKLGVGIELNSGDMSYAESEESTVLRPFKIAKKCGCKFYFGSDAHHPQNLNRAKSVFEKAVDALALTENDKFIIQ